MNDTDHAPATIQELFSFTASVLEKLQSSGRFTADEIDALLDDMLDLEGCEQPDRAVVKRVLLSKRVSTNV